MKRILFVAAAVAAVVSCNKAETPVPVGNDSPSGDDGLVYMEFSAVTDLTKTSLDGLDVVWSQDDAISVFVPGADGAANARFDAVSVHGGDAVFGGSALMSDTYYALYPYQGDAALQQDNMSVYLPFEQRATAGSFAEEANLAAAVWSGDAMLFRNLCSVVKFTLPDSVPDFVSACFKGNNRELLSGNSIVNFGEEYPVLSVGSDGESSVVLTGSMTAGNTYCFVVAPAVLTGGFTISFVDSEGNYYSATGKNEALLTRSKILNLGELPLVKDESLHISDENGLKAWIQSSEPSSSVVLESDIALSGNWEPAFPEGFSGVFDGNGKKITGLKVSSESDFAGFFASLLPGALVKDLTVEAGNVSTTSQTGSAGVIAGFNLGTIENCTVRPLSGSRISVSAPTYAGAVAGNNSFRIFNCSVSGADVSTSGQSGAIGGISGVNHGWIEGCTVSSSTLIASGTAALAGGITGHNSRQSSAKSAYIMACSVDDIQVSAVNAGGLVGTNEGTSLSAGIFRSSVAGESSVSGLEGSNSRVGSLVGYATRSDIVACSSVGATVGGVSTKGSVGGMVGYNYRSDIYGCHASGVSVSGTVGTGSDYGIGLMAGYSSSGSIVRSCYVTGTEGLSAIGNNLGTLDHCVSNGNDYTALTSAEDFSDGFGKVWKAASLWDGGNPPSIVQTYYGE